MVRSAAQGVCHMGYPAKSFSPWCRSGAGSSRTPRGEPVVLSMQEVSFKARCPSMKDGPCSQVIEPTSNNAFFGKLLDFARASAEQLGQHPHIVLAVAGRTAIGRAADIGRRLAELHRQLVDRPGADLRAGDFRQPFEMPQLGVGVDAVLGILA